ncbi:histidine kinase [Hahella sp. CCB-MM4]|uniref:PAS domain-containing hybrid sensor histidine kinase/response regulator n=1 Tax=Hahella sp. (strain CCB-MM4) TaxID=1926491 RepID=UPI000B9B869A|nr:NahK/ErcS family hybrid sensor histidine kinase/response regulator [Hahella sp. CCB-MM4]OZG72538.1 histidine kinase [Hahella sp. CCB-MM4]
MINGFLLFIVSIAYIAILFGIAYFGDQNTRVYAQQNRRRAIYSLSLGVYCTSWTFYGAVGSSAQNGLGFMPIYLGPIVVLIFGAPLIARIIRISKRHNTTSIADFIASRYGKSQSLAVIVTLIALVGIVPYIALQLKAVSMGFNVLTEGGQVRSIEQTPYIQDSALYVALVMGLFTILFGTRHIDATEHHRGLIQAVAFESIVKLVAFVAVGILVSIFLFDGWGDITRQLRTTNQAAVFSFDAITPSSFIVQTLLAGIAIICLPRQFHVSVVENYEPRDIYTARWALPVYLLALTVFVIPIAAAGILIYPNGTIDSDIFVLSIPMVADYEWLAMLAFIGGGSAATSMVIVSTVTLSTMVCNEIIVPLLLRIQALDLSRKKNVQFWLLTIRRVTILVNLLAAYGYYRLMGDSFSLASIGLLSFVAVAQFAPVLIGGVLWRYGNRQGAISGLVCGFAIWIYTLLVPTIIQATNADSTLISEGLLGIAWLRPTALFGLDGFDLITHGTIWSLGFNILLYLVVSAITTQRVIERIQVASFLDSAQSAEASTTTWVSEATVEDISALSERFLGPERTQETLKDYSRRNRVRLSPNRPASVDLIKHIEKQLASAIGSSTARVVLNSALKGQNMQIEDVVSIVDEASQVIKFNRELLQSAIENMNLGVAVVDDALNLVAWNSRYVELFNYPQGFTRVGRPIADLMRYNLLMAHVPARRAQKIISRRLEMMKSGEAHEYERMRPDGTVLLIQGSPMPGGGFVTTFSDISAMRRTELALKETNTYLEQRVKERTEELSKLNKQLVKAKSVAENANLSKTRFLASASHDLLQPLNAARLFTSALANKVKNENEYNELVSHIDHSLNAAEEILSTLLDISKLDAGALEPHYSVFNINELLGHLNTEFTVIAAEKGLGLRTVPCNAFVNSDHQLLRRVIQNFLTNAIRYTRSGRILLGCRRHDKAISIEIWDTGPGIPEDQLSSIFEEFKRLNQNTEKNGLGLGLAIVDRICRMLDYRVEVKSILGKGSMFSVTLPVVSKPVESLASPKKVSRSLGSLEGTVVFCIDNEPVILEGMRALLEGWGCTVFTASNPNEAVTTCMANPPEIILADYQLDEGDNGLDTMDMLRRSLARNLPGILITAVNNDEVKMEVKQRGYQILHKPVKPAALRAMINKELSKN